MAAQVLLAENIESVQMNSMNVFQYFFVLQGAITNILEENVVQPLLVSTSAVTLAAETVRSILKIDDVVSVHLFFLVNL